MSDARVTFTDLGDGVTADAVGVTVTLLAGDRGPTGVGVTAGVGAPAGTAPAGTLYVDTATGDLYRWDL